MNPHDNRGQTDFWSQSYDFGSYDYGDSQQQQQQQQHLQQQQQYLHQANSNSFYASSSFDASNPFGGSSNVNTFDGSLNSQMGSDDPYANEPPLLEELGINFEHIMQKTIAVLNPFKQTDATILHDSDLAGPLVFCLAFGAFLLLSGKVHFSYIYGFGVLGCILLYSLLILMSPPNVTFTAVCTVSILGYCLLPLVFLAALAIFVSLTANVGMILALIVILWCALSASKLFVTALQMQNQQALIAYPCILFYGVFALLALF